jgi:hypothetical protein
VPPLYKRAEHPYRVETIDELPDGLRDLARKALLPDDPAEKIFVIPEQMLSRKTGRLVGMDWVQEQSLLFTHRGVVHVRAGKSDGDMGQANYLAGSSLLYVQMSLILLYGRMELCAAANDELSRIVVEYNAVCHEMLEPSVHRLIRLAGGPAHAQNANDSRDFLLGKLEAQSLKFRNGLAIHALQPDEKLLGYVFQPRLYPRYFRLVRRLIAPASLIALTDQQFIMIEEGMKRAPCYGYVFTYCPRANVVVVDTEPTDTLQEVCLHLRKDAFTADHRLTLKNETVLALRDLCSSNGIVIHRGSSRSGSQGAPRPVRPE